MSKVRMLVTVKAYPALSSSRGEAVCVAGIRQHEDGNVEWARLWPVPFRDLDFIRRFETWQWITVDAEPSAPKDTRPESLRPNADSIAMGDKISTQKATWRERMDYLEPLMAPSMCEIRLRQEADGTSLGAFRPKRIDVLNPVPATEWKESQRAVASQVSLLQPNKPPLEWIPWKFRYRYWCDDSGCENGHSMSVIDWGLAELYRKYRREGGDAAARTAVMEKMEELGDLSTKDMILMVGNQHLRPQTFMIIGYAYPKRSEGQGHQLGLQLL